MKERNENLAFLNATTVNTPALICVLIYIACIVIWLVRQRMLFLERFIEIYRAIPERESNRTKTHWNRSKSL